MSGKQRLRVSLCEFQGGDFELYLIDPDTLQEITISGVRKFSDKERELLARLLPPCVFSTYEACDER